MGRMKQYMMEQWEDQEVVEPIEIEVSFFCPVCAHPAASWVHFPGDEEEYSTDVTCLNPEEDHQWSVSITRDDDDYSGVLDQYPDNDVSVKAMDTSDDWEEPLPEPGAHGIFMEAMRDWRSDVDAIAQPQGDSSRNRMLFTTLYSILEAYLSDSIIGSALVDVSVQRRLIKLKELDLHDKKLDLDTVLENPNVVRDMLRAVLQKFSFHKLVPVSRIAEISFGKPILPREQGDRALVVASVQKRHDCVHRNGIDTEGKQHTDITKDYLNKMGGVFEDLAAALEDAIIEAEAQRFFEDLEAKDETKSE